MKIISLFVSIVSIIGMILSILIKPNIKIKNKNFQTFYILPLLGAIVIFFINFDKSNEIISSFLDKASVNPLQIIALFFSMVFISTVLDEVGFFNYLANKAIKYAHNNQKVLLLILTILTAFLTIFTSNDIIIITFTPFIIFFTRRAKVSPIPYLIVEFVTANTWSMLLLIGNPTNIYLGETFNIDFFSYLKMMFIPTIFSGLISSLLCFLLFAKKLKQKIEINIDNAKIKNKTIFIITLSILIICTIFVSISSYINIPMWLIAVILGLSLLIFLLIYCLIKKEYAYVLIDSIKRLPYSLIPLLLSMFVIVICLKLNGFTNDISNLLDNDLTIIKYGTLSFLSANIINNIPMSVLFSEIIKSSPSINLKAVYASIIGSNIAAYLSPLGALAGIMWLSILKKENIDFSFFSFLKYGLIIAPITLISALFGLYISFIWF